MVLVLFQAVGTSLPASCKNWVEISPPACLEIKVADKDCSLKVLTDKGDIITVPQPAYRSRWLTWIVY